MRRLDDLFDLFAALLPGLVMAGVLGLFAGCASAPARAPELPPPVAAAAPAPEAGAIWSEGQGLALFQDQKARSVGDLLTVLLVEATDAKTTSATSTSKNNSTDIAAPRIFGRPVTVKGVPVLSAAMESEHAFSGAGASSQSNKLSGSVTVSVIERLPGGMLRVRGGKTLNINQGEEYVRIEGLVRPADIAPDNTVLSSRVADARIAYGDNGALGESNEKGWLARFFSSGWMPF